LLVQQAWQAPTLLNGWVNFGVAQANAGYYRDAGGIVHVRGTIKSGTINVACFILPVGYRPTANSGWATISNGLFGAIVVTSIGEVLIVGGSNAYYYLDAIFFRAEQ